MNKEKIEEIGKEFVEKVLNFSFRSMAEKTNANRLLKAFVAGAETILKNAHDFEFPNDIEDKEPAVEIEVVPVRKELVQAPVGLCRKIEQKVVFSLSDKKINDLISEGWTITTTTPVYVSSQGHGSDQKGEICFVLEREV